MPKTFRPQAAATGRERMAKERGGEVEMSPIIDQGTRPGVVFRLTVFIAVLTASALLFAVFQETLGEAFLMIVLAILAMIGVGYLFASTIGFVQVAPRATGEDLSRAFIDTMNEGLLVTDARGRILYRSEEHTSELQSRENLVC